MSKLELGVYSNTTLITVKTTLTTEDLILAKSLAPEKLEIRDENKELKFKVTLSNRASVSPYGIAFVPMDDKKLKLALALEIDYNEFTPFICKFIESNLNAIEKNVQQLSKKSDTVSVNDYTKTSAKEKPSVSKEEGEPEC